MNRIIVILVFVLHLTPSFAQELKGVWMSYNNRIPDKYKLHTTGDEGILMDFDNFTMGHIKSDTLVKMKVKSKKNIAKIKVNGIKGKGRFKIYGKDSIEMNSGDNKVHVFRKLNLTHKIPMSEKEIINFFIANNFDSIQGIKGKFSSDQFFRDKSFGNPHTKNQFENKTWKDAGYWFIKKINGNAFLIFTIGQTERMNILQILSVNKKGLKLNHLQEDYFMRNITEIQTCL